MDLLAQILLAQIPQPPNAGADPVVMWVYAILQGGALMLLAYIICVRDPKDRDADVKERERRDVMFTKALEMVQAKFFERNEKLVGAVERQTDKLTTEMRNAADRQADGLQNQSDSIGRMVGTICKSK